MRLRAFYDDACFTVAAQDAFLSGFAAEVAHALNIKVELVIDLNAFHTDKHNEMEVLFCVLSLGDCYLCLLKVGIKAIDSSTDRHNEVLGYFCVLVVLLWVLLGAGLLFNEMAASNNPPPAPIHSLVAARNIFQPTVHQVRFIIAPGQSGADQPIENLREQLLLQVCNPPPSPPLTRERGQCAWDSPAPVN